MTLWASLEVEWEGVLVGRLWMPEWEDFSLVGEWQGVHPTLSERLEKQLEKGNPVDVMCHGMKAQMCLPPSTGRVEIRIFPCEDSQAILEKLSSIHEHDRSGALRFVEFVAGSGSNSSSW